MKQLKISDIQLNVYENINELSATREKDLRLLYFSLIQYEKSPLELMLELRKDFNNQHYSTLGQKIENYIEFLNINKSVNIYNSIFALITLLENENVAELSNIEVKNKMQLLEKKGLTFDVVKKEVVNFMRAYPQIQRAFKILTA